MHHMLPIRRRGALIGKLVCAAALCFASSAQAGDFDLAITETSIVNLRQDNQNSSLDDDNYGEWLNRLNVQGKDGPFTVAVRLDSALYFNRPNPNNIGREAARRARAADVEGLLTQTDQELFQNARDAAGRNLSSRYQNTLYPAKVFVTYQPNAELSVTAGDYYAQFGKGMVLSMRKVDELAVDTTIRGLKATYKPRIRGAKLALTGLAGYTNPIRIDNPSGRQLSQNAHGTWEKLLFLGSPGPNSTQYEPNPRPAFSPDRIIGAQVEGGVKQAIFGLRGVRLDRGYAEHLDEQIVPGRANKSIGIVSVSANFPNIAEHGSLYGELAYQSLGDPQAGLEDSVNERLTGGTALYMLGSAYYGKFTLTGEFKHYRRFYPLSANIDANRPEFALVQYNVPPTTELVIQDSAFGMFNVCVTGGRGRLDYRAAKQLLLYASVGRYATWTEEDDFYCGQKNIDGTATGPTDHTRNDIWDTYMGTELTWDHGRSHAYVFSGMRLDQAAAPRANLANSGRVFYREHYVRYDVVKKIYGKWSVEAQGFHRYRYSPSQLDQPWRVGENYLSVIWAPKITAAFGFEYTSQFGNEFQNFYNGFLQYRVTTATLVRAFYGNSRAALRCVSGVCRMFPAFSGAKLEAVVRY